MKQNLILLLDTINMTSEMLPQTKDAIKFAAAAAENLEKLRKERHDRFVLERDDQSRRWIDLDKQRLDNDIATAAVNLDKTAHELDTMLPQHINKDYFAEHPWTLKREKRNFEEYRDALRALVKEGLVTQTRLDREARKRQSVSILHWSFDPETEDYAPIKNKRVKTEHNDDAEVKIKRET